MTLLTTTPPPPSTASSKKSKSSNKKQNSYYNSILESTMGSGMAAEYSYLLQEEVDHPSSPFSEDSSEMDLFDDLRSVDSTTALDAKVNPTNLEAPSVSSSPLAENIPTTTTTTQPPLQEYLGLSDDDEDEDTEIISSPPLSRSIQKRRALANRLFSNQKDKNDSWSTHSALRELETSLQLQQSPAQVQTKVPSSRSKQKTQQAAHIQVLQKQLQEQQSLLETLEQDKKALQNQLTQQQVQSESELEEALDLYETLQQQHSNLQHQHQQTVVDKSQLESQVSTLSQTNRDLEAQLELLQSRHDTLVKELETTVEAPKDQTTDQVDQQLTLLQTQLDLEVDRRLAAEAQVQQLLLRSRQKEHNDSDSLVDDVLQDMTALTHERQQLLKELNIQDGEDGESNHGSSLQHSSHNDNDDASWQANMLNVSAASSSKLLQQDDISTASTPTHTNTSGLQLLNASHSVSTTSNLMNQTLELMQNMTAVLNSPQGSQNNQETKDQETSILLNQLEALHELMNKDSNENETDSFVMNDESTILQAEDDPLNTSAISHASSSSTTMTSPWFALVQELRRTVDYLQHDRSELERITQDQLDRLKNSHGLELEAAIATARREGRASVQQTLVCPKCGTETTQS